MWNAWSKDVCAKIFADTCHEHLWDKWKSLEQVVGATSAAAEWYISLDDGNLRESGSECLMIVNDNSAKIGEENCHTVVLARTKGTVYDFFFNLFIRDPELIPPALHVIASLHESNDDGDDDGGDGIDNPVVERTVCIN